MAKACIIWLLFILVPHVAGFPADAYGPVTPFFYLEIFMFVASFIFMVTGIWARRERHVSAHVTSTAVKPLLHEHAAARAPGDPTLAANGDGAYAAVAFAGETLRGRVAACVLDGDDNQLVRLLRTPSYGPPFLDPTTNVPLLIAASQQGNLPICKALVDAGEDVNIRNVDGTTPLMVACSRGFLDLVQFFLQNELVDVAARDNHGYDCISRCVRERQPDMLQTILDVARPSLTRSRVEFALREKAPKCLALFLPRTFPPGQHILLGPLLRQACDIRDPEIVKPFISLEQFDQRVGMAALKYCLLNRNDDMVPVLARTIDVNAVMNNSTLLMDMCKKGEWEQASMLLDYGADPSLVPGMTESTRRTSPLMYATLANEANIIDKMIKKGACVDTVDARMKTPLTLACERGSVEAARVLLSHHADASVRTSKGGTLCILAASTGNASLLQLLVDSSANVTQRDSSGVSPLDAAARNGHVKCVKYLLPVLDKLPSILTDNPACEPPLDWAASSGQLAVVRLLVESNYSDVRQRDAGGATALAWACSKGHHDVAEYLTEMGSDVNNLDDEMSSPLSWAAWHGHDSIVRMLLIHGANVNILNGRGSSPLHHAAYSGRVPVAKVLIEGQADVNLLDGFGETPLDVAIRGKGGRELIDLLKAHGAEANKSRRKNSSGKRRTGGSYKQHRRKKSSAMLRAAEFQARASRSDEVIPYLRKKKLHHSEEAPHSRKKKQHSSSEEEFFESFNRPKPNSDVRKRSVDVDANAWTKF